MGRPILVSLSFPVLLPMNGFVKLTIVAVIFSYFGWSEGLVIFRLEETSNAVMD
jgi:uncharacterized membrane protein YvlD (DUF360 family)